MSEPVLNAAHPIWLQLSPPQVERVIRQLTAQGGMQGLLIDKIDHLRVAVSLALADFHSKKLSISRSTLTALRIWTAFSPDGSARGLKEIAAEVGISPSSTHRYVDTLVIVGLLERTAERKYRLPVTQGEPPDADTQQ